MDKLIIATRGSRLALWQAQWVMQSLKQLHTGLEVELLKIKTTGDKILDVPLAKVGGKGLFVKEIEEAMLRGEAHLAVHSMKDVPTELPEGLHLSVICEREDPRDAFIVPASSQHNSIKELPKGARVGTSSLRRSCQILSRRPDLSIESLRGNLDTRLRKLDEGLYDCIILAAAGVKRLGYNERIRALLEPEASLPAIGQGAVGIECPTDDVYINGLLAPLNHTETALCVRAERAFLTRLEGGCQVPIAAYAVLSGNEATLTGLVGSIDGKTIIKNSMTRDVQSPGAPEALGNELAGDLLDKGAREILDEVYGNC